MSAIQEQVIRTWLGRQEDDKALVALLLSSRAAQIAAFQTFQAQLQAETQARLDSQAAEAAALTAYKTNLGGAF